MAKQTTAKKAAPKTPKAQKFTVLRHANLGTYYMALTSKLKHKEGQKIFQVIGTADSKKAAAAIVSKHRKG